MTITLTEQVAKGIIEKLMKGEDYRVEVIALIQEEQQGCCSVGLRSNGAWDVGTLARSMGGGGHTLAAGYSVSGTIATTRERLLQALASLL